VGAADVAAGGMAAVDEAIGADWVVSLGAMVVAVAIVVVPIDAFGVGV
jgi:hypothetical protein